MTARATLHLLGPVLYTAGLTLQRDLAEAVRGGEDGHLLVLEHDPVYTLGHHATEGDIHVGPEILAREGISVHRTDRGGQVTWHGPGQVVVYPVCPVPGRGVGAFVQALEEAMIRTASDFGVTARREAGRAGIWVGERKLGALGIHVSRRVATHGLAFNVAPDLRAFGWITPCGMADRGVCSLASLLGAACPSWDLAARTLARRLGETLGLELRTAPEPASSISVSVWRRRAGLIEYLILERQPWDGGWWSPVTGMVEPGETLEQAALREVQEETGLVGPLRDLGLSHTFRVPERGFFRETCFHMEVSVDAVLDLAVEEHRDYRWCGLEEALALVGWDSARAALRRLAGALGC
nr:lipoyl(octanoyl) transferase LipB [uncultured Holophaga sp.]